MNSVSFPEKYVWNETEKRDAIYLGNGVWKLIGGYVAGKTYSIKLTRDKIHG